VKARVASLLAGALLVAAGCGTAPPPTPVTLTLTGLNFTRGAQVRADALDAFTRETGIRVVLIPTWGTSSQQYDQASRLLGRRSSTPDVYLLDLVWIGGLADHLLDLTPHLAEADLQHLPELLAGDRIGGRVVALPFYASVGLLHYRRDLLSRYGYPRPPETWDELEAMAARIQKGERAAGHADFWGFVFQGAAYEGLTCNALEWQVSHGGGRILEPAGRVSIDSPGARLALERARGWVGSISPPGVLYYREDEAAAVFQAGRAAFLRHWNALAPERPESPEPARDELAPLPAGPAGRAQVLGGFHLAVSRYTDHPREAARLVTFLAGAEVQKRRALLHGFLPTRPSLLADPEVVRAVPWVTAVAAGAGHGVLRPSSVAGARYAEVSRDYYETVHRVLAGAVPADRALAELEARLVVLTGLRPGPPGDPP
jgi:trehalose/maltose transport system substrate-binding protein